MKNVMIWIVACSVVFGAMHTSVCAMDTEDDAPNNFFFPFGKPKPKETLDSSLKKSLSDFEEAWNFLKSQCKALDASRVSFQKRLWEKPLTECIRCGLNIFWFVSILTSITGMSMLAVLMSYVGPKLAYKYFTLIYEFAAFMERFFGAGASATVSQCFLQTAEGVFGMPCDMIIPKQPGFLRGAMSRFGL